MISFARITQAGILAYLLYLDLLDPDCQISRRSKLARVDGQRALSSERIVVLSDLIRVGDIMVKVMFTIEC